jgi:uncharacterized membrane protein YphA (DoxX/SURF4 family)
MKNEILKTLLGLVIFSLIGGIAFLFGYYPKIAIYVIGVVAVAAALYAANFFGGIFWPHIKEILKKD